jgi:sphingolipid delta-4 desaturase
MKQAFHCQFSLLGIISEKRFIGANLTNIKNPELDYHYVTTTNWHTERSREMIVKYPAIRKLMGPEKSSKYWISALVMSQLILAVYATNLSWWLFIPLSYFVGGFINHALFVMIHECCHNLVVKSATGNKIWALVCDVANAIPSAMGFSYYHIYHHLHLGEYNYDPDLVSYGEGNLIGKSPLRKALWLTFFMFSQALRPMKVKHYRLFNKWIFINLFLIIATDVLIVYFFGFKALTYLLLSTFFGLGLHPAGGRWIAEHYETTPDQETYSYYGPLNKIAFNMGYHIEHHDFLNIPWSRLPKLAELAPEYYKSLPHYKSWTGVLIKFIFSPDMNAFSRIVHPDRHPSTLKNLS